MTLIAGFVVLLMLGFWLIGARNRLMRLRQAVVQSFPALEMQLRKRHALARHLAEASVLAETVSRDTAEAVHTAARQATSALDATMTRVTAAAAIRQLGAAEEALANALPPVMPPADALSAQPAEPTVHSDVPEEPIPRTVAVAIDPTVAELQARVVQLHAPLDYARQAYNGAVQAYNAALRVFPTTLAAKVFHFEAAALLPRLSRPVS